MKTFKAIIHSELSIRANDVGEAMRILEEKNKIIENSNVILYEQSK